MLKWNKIGLIFTPPQLDWKHSHALQPTPLLLGNIIRIFVGFRDRLGRSRVGYVDVDSTDPTKIVSTSEQPVLDLGDEGCFDENGVVPCAVVPDGERLYSFYAGYRKPAYPQKKGAPRFQVFGGLACSLDNGMTFSRVSNSPVLGPSKNESLFRVAHSVIRRDDKNLWSIFNLHAYASS
jgi:hypothetical protein